MDHKMGLETFKALVTSKHSLELQVFTSFLIVLVFAEVVTSFVDPGYGLFFHSLILISLLTLSSLKHGENPSSKFYLSLALAPLIRIISLSVPLTNFPRYSWYIVVNIPVLVATLAMMRVKGIGLKDAGIIFKKPIEVAGIALTGIPIVFLSHAPVSPLTPIRFLVVL